MTLEQIIALSQAGFTKQEILSLANTTPQSTPQPTSQPPTTPNVASLPGAPQAAHTSASTPARAPAQAQAQVQAQAEAQGTASENGVLSKLNELEKLLLMGNVGGSQMPEQTTADDMLAAIINPFDNK